MTATRRTRKPERRKSRKGKKGKNQGGVVYVIVMAPPDNKNEVKH